MTSAEREAILAYRRAATAVVRELSAVSRLTAAALDVLVTTAELNPADDGMGDGDSVHEIAVIRDRLAEALGVLMPLPTIAGGEGARGAA